MSEEVVRGGLCTFPRVGYGSAYLMHNTSRRDERQFCDKSWVRNDNLRRSAVNFKRVANLFA
jgi:hypothetical protein